MIIDSKALESESECEIILFMSKGEDSMVMPSHLVALHQLDRHLKFWYVGQDGERLASTFNWPSFSALTKISPLSDPASIHIPRPTPHHTTPHRACLFFIVALAFAPCNMDGHGWQDRQSETETCEQKHTSTKRSRGVAYLAGHEAAVEGGRRREVVAVTRRGVHVDGEEGGVPGAGEEPVPEGRERQRATGEEHEGHLGRAAVRVPPDAGPPRRRPQQLLVGHVVPGGRGRPLPPVQRRLPRRRWRRQHGVRGEGQPREHGRVGRAAEEQDHDGEEPRAQHRQEEERAEELQGQRRRWPGRASGVGAAAAVLAVAVHGCCCCSLRHADQLKGEIFCFFRQEFVWEIENC